MQTRQRYVLNGGFYPNTRHVHISGQTNAARDYDDVQRDRSYPTGELHAIYAAR